MNSLRYLLRVSVFLWLFFIAGSLVAAPTISIDGAPFDAELHAVDNEWNLQFVTPAGDVKKLPAAELVQWGTWPEPKGAKQVMLADGGILIAAEVLGMQDEKLVVESDLLTTPTVRLPLSAVAGVIFQAPLDGRRRERLEDRVLSAAGDAERLLLANGDELTGTITAFSQLSLKLKTAAGTTPLDITRVAAAIFDPSLRAKPVGSGLSAWVGLRDGSRLRAVKLFTKGQQAEMTLAGEVTIRVPLDEIVGLQPIGGSAIYLSDLKPAGYKHIPFLNLSWDYRMNRSAVGNALRAGGQRYWMGLGMHSAARLTYDLDGPFRRFEALLAVDDETAGRGSVVGKVFTDDGNGEWKLKYESPIIRGGQAPVPVSVDLSGAKRLSLLIDFADRGDEGDHADWLNARLVKP